MKLKHYLVTIKGGAGIVSLPVWAATQKAAKESVLAGEGPPREVLSVKEIKK